MKTITFYYKQNPEEIEKQTPFFTKDGDCYYGFYSEDNKITVQDFKIPLIVCMIATESIAAAYQEITAKEFEDKFMEVVEKITDQFEQGRDIVTANSGLTTDSFQVREEDRIK